MDLHANSIASRSHHASPSLPYLRVLLSISTSSIGGLLGLGEASVQAYPVLPESDLTSAIDSITTETETATPERIVTIANDEATHDVYEFDLRFDAMTDRNAQIELESDSETELFWGRSSIISELANSASESIDSLDFHSNDLDHTDTLPPSSLQADNTELDWVEQFDQVYAATERELWVEQSQESTVVATDDGKESTEESTADQENDLGQYVTRAADLLPESSTSPPIELAETPNGTETEQPLLDSVDRLVLNLQGVYLLEGNDSSARARLSGNYLLAPNVLFGATLDWTTGDAFGETAEDGVDLSELFVTITPSTVPTLRFTVGMIDLTGYFDRNSFAKDAATQFFNPVFQTNPALASAGLGSRPGLMVNWDVTDQLILRGAAFSSDRDLGDFTFDSAAAEVGVRIGNGIIRGTYVNSRDAGRQSGFREIFQFDRGNDAFGVLSGDREVAYGVNAEYFIPEVNLGLFARYGWYNNQTLGQSGNTYSFGVNVLDLFFADDRLGLAYGRELSNNCLRRDRGDEIPDVFEAFYDVRLTRNLRAGVSLQGRDAWSETVLGLRVRADLDLARLWR
ncbi:hypothetical protein [Egbenema bharatensis]|uniref:hypothetical protein n=1 Tax=Egbenema bharatensis TaxID=3463334 RepID=UPI003A875332